MLMKKLSAHMRACLRSALAGDSSMLAGNTLRGLKRRGFIDPSGGLTEDGWRQAVLLSKLPAQCEQLEIPIRAINGLKYEGDPERAVWLRLKEEGYEGSYCEGGAVLIIIRAAALDVLARLNAFGSREDACSRFTEAQLTIHETRIPEITAAIEEASLDSVLRNFHEIYRSQMVQEAYPELTDSGIGALFNAIGPKRLKKIAEAIAENPYQYRAGWPDLTMAKGDEMLWAEVKTTDKLHMSQIITIGRMKSLLPGDVCVFHVRSA